MNKYILLLTLFFSVIYSSISQTTWTWTGISSTLWNDELNWDDGSGFTGVPGATDHVVFDINSGSNNCTVNVSTPVLGSISINDGYTGVITQNALLQTVDFSISSATFNGGTNVNLIINGSFLQTGGVFTAPTSALTNSGMTRVGSSSYTSGFSSSGGVFNHNGGTFFFSNNSFAVNNNRTFYNVTFNNSGTGGVTFTITDTITVLNTLTINTGTLQGIRPITLNGGAIKVAGNLAVKVPNQNNPAPTTGGGTTKIILNGTGTQTITGRTVLGEVPLPSLEITATTPRIIDFAASDQNITVNSDLTISGTAPVTINTGTIFVKGNVNITNTGSAGGGTGTINLNNAASTQAIFGTNVIGTGVLPNLTVNKGLSNLALFNVVSLAGNLTNQSIGQIVQTEETVVAFVGTGNQTIPSSNDFEYNHLAISGSGTKTIADTLLAENLTLFNTDLIAPSPHLVRISGEDPSSVTYNGSGKVVGTLERYIALGETYTYQVGLQDGPVQALDINFSDRGLDNYFVSIRFNDGSTIGTSTVTPSTEAGVTFDRIVSGGYWEINGDGSDETGPIYTATLHPSGFSFQENEAYTIFKRTGGGPWEALGTPIDDPNNNIDSTSITRSNITGFSNLAVAAAEFTPTPVDLFSFDVKLVEDYVQLDWVTKSETKSSHFVIERSRDSKNFDSIATVLSAGNSNVTLKYDYADLTATDILADKLYYRLKQVDVDGVFKIYPMKSVSVVDIIRDSKIKIFPNPGTIEVNVASFLKEDVQLDIYNPLGKKIGQKYLTEEKTAINTSSLEAGVYVFKFVNGSTVINKRVIIK